ncbi:transcriptional regulator, Fur family [Geotalea daltonii FRC-32]|uniref:Transcriptional regulator, Fur family n=1 Tax=Geotalea daltonii (strain DSM 22248 / JCM 15807 / FRC-32) TaxID=316067 RepID=B9M7W1_GEODF|nr:transcriptional repressor [Geotalea daltonii]ACM18419.1 transcriptional regulator, Fur family [Geotalea daltonii FRC-32]
MSDKFNQDLKELKLKVTPKRLAILSLLAEELSYASPEEVWRKLQKNFDSIGLPTVYRNLEELANGGLITKVIHPNRQLYYYFCPNGHHHHHFVCLSCRKVEDINFCGMEEIEKKVSGTVLSHIVQVNGLCRECSESQGGAI